MKKYIAILLLCLIIVSSLLLTSCTKKQKEEEVIKIGLLGHQTGFGAIWGEAEIKAANLAIEEIKAKGCKIDYVVEDCESDVTKCVTAANKLINIDKVRIIIGPTWDEWFIPVAELAERNKVLLISPSGQSEKDIGPYTFSLKYTYEGIADKILNFLEEKNEKTIALVTTKNAYFENIEKAIVNLQDKYQININKYNVNPEEKDFKTLLTKIKKEGISWIVANVVQTDILNFISQAKQFGFSNIIYTSVIEKTSENEKIVERVYVVDYHINSNFKEKYKNKYGSLPSPSAQMAYDAIYLIYEASEKCSVVDIENIRKNLENIKEYNGTAGTIIFDERGYAKWDKNVFVLKKI